MAEEESANEHDLASFRSIDLITRKMATLLVAHDGRVSVAEQEWLETHWGLGAHLQVIHLAALVTSETLAEEIRGLLGEDASLCGDLRQSLETLRESVGTGSEDEEHLDRTLEVLNEFEAEADEAE